MWQYNHKWSNQEADSSFYNIFAIIPLLWHWNTYRYEPNGTLASKWNSEAPKIWERA